jgi:hypothetical protein
MVKRTTRRNRNSKKHMTIPELKGAFENVQREAHSIIKEGGSSAEQVKKFQKVWKTIFHRPVTSTAADAYLKFQRITKQKRSSTRKQRGGAALSGAPLDYTLRQGVDSSYGNFLEYQSAGLKFYDTVNQEGMFQECGTKDISPNIGSQSGGNWSDATHKTPAPVSTPPSLINNVEQYLAGRPTAASPAPYQG